MADAASGEGEPSDKVCGIADAVLNLTRGSILVSLCQETVKEGR